MPFVNVNQIMRHNYRLHSVEKVICEHVVIRHVRNAYCHLCQTSRCGYMSLYCQCFQCVVWLRCVICVRDRYSSIGLR